MYSKHPSIPSNKILQAIGEHIGDSFRAMSIAAFTEEDSNFFAAVAEDFDHRHGGSFTGAEDLRYIFEVLDQVQHSSDKWVEDAKRVRVEVMDLWMCKIGLV